jgi:hypothetical protein
VVWLHVSAVIEQVEGTSWAHTSGWNWLLVSRAYPAMSVGQCKIRGHPVTNGDITLVEMQATFSRGMPREACHEKQCPEGQICLSIAHLLAMV